ncbi:putative alcohol dehydrogenase [Acaromyces ingoldii]|uniref:Putative alcohol dehydrogenase n=1 Tax=Acaromyces ingoldii TaxID=215250 RepID=A0A316YC52_9BASI|nr:putative alcohol dehydrogenase [Acaromyces ingoldii]PWN87096.1 putative alcohol dehydrogenase [Acaromyces ingoldii]
MSQQEHQFWQLPAPNARGSFDSLALQTGPTPKPGPGEVLVAVKAASLNFRDLIIALGKYPLDKKDAPTIPASDGAGEVVAVGEGVTKFKPKDRVAAIFNAGHQRGSTPNRAEKRTGLGGSIDGMLSQYRALPETALVHIPQHLSWEEAATLPCAAVTAWNGLFGLPSNVLQPGETVVCEGTGGVSVFGAQFAIAAGAKVVITSSSDEKLDRVRKLFSQEKQALLTTVNYKTNPDWDKEVLKVSGEEGAAHVLDVGGPGTLEKAFNTIRPGGVVSDIGFVGKGEVPNLSALVLGTTSVYRGILVGSREMFEQMNAAIDVHKLKPLVDKVFDWKDAKKAYEYQWSGSHAGKVVIRIGS